MDIPTTNQAVGEDTPIILSDSVTASVDEDYQKELSFSAIKSNLNHLVTSWKAEQEETVVRRKIRKIELDVEQMRKDGSIDEDETFIPVRVIDTNIQREQPPYINYLKNSRRLALFRCADKYGFDTQRLEEEFTTGMTYLGWEVPHFKCIDGSATHGWDSVEIVYDAAMPLHVGIEHIGHDKLFFPHTCKNIQDSPELIRQYDVTSVRLKAFVNTFGFSPEQVKKLLDVRKDSPSRKNETITIYKRLFKLDGVVWVAWFALTDGVDDWLKAPEKLYIGIDEQKQSLDDLMQPIMSWQPADVTQYPIVLLPYRESEDSSITEFKGRVFLDENKQEACTTILTGFANKLTRSARVYGAPEGEDGTGGSLKELGDIKLANSTILNKPFKFWSLEGPDPMLIKALQYMDTANAQETNQVNFAATNREDSRKTAKEITSSEQQQALLNGVQLTLFSTYIRTIYSFAWLIVQSQALQKNIKFLQTEIKIPVLDPIYQQPIVDPLTGQPQVITQLANNTDVIGMTYDIRAAGDVDVVQRQEKIMQMKQDWAVIQNTPLAIRFLADLMKLEYADTGEAYAAEIMKIDQMVALQQQVQALATIVQGAIQQNPEMFNSLPPQQQQQLQQLLASIPQSQQQKA